MLNTYKALNYLQLGEPDKARVELIRAYQRQQDAVTDNQRRIEKVQGEAAQSKDKATMDKAEADPKFKSQMQGAYTDLDNLKAYANYVNPFTVYLDGLYFMANAADASDLERAYKSLERVAGYDSDNRYVKQDLAALDGVMQGKPLAPTTYVIFETGCASVRDQIRIDIPIIVAKVSYVGAAFPTLKPQGNYLPSLTVTANSPIITANDTVTTASSATTTTGDTNTPAAGATAVTGNTNTTVTSTITTVDNTNATVTSTTTTVDNTNATVTSTTTTTGDTNAVVTGTTTITTNTNTSVTSTIATTGDTNATVTGTTTTTSSTTATATISSTTATTSPIASMDSVIGLDFKNELPVVITKTIAATITKAVAAYAINEAANQQGALYGLVSQIGTAVYQMAVNIADERTWTTLPKEFQVCRFSTPPDRKIVLETPGGLQKIPVTIGDGTINIVYVRSMTATGPLLVTQMKLK
jgi:hypothetical protein